METGKDRRRARLSIDVEPDLRRKIRIAAARRDLSIRDYVVTVLQHALVEEEQRQEQAEEKAWTELSARSFARDWDSEEDAIYDKLS